MAASPTLDSTVKLLADCLNKMGLIVSSSAWTLNITLDEVHVVFKKSLTNTSSVIELTNDDAAAPSSQNIATQSIDPDTLSSASTASSIKDPALLKKNKESRNNPVNDNHASSQHSATQSNDPNTSSVATQKPQNVTMEESPNNDLDEKINHLHQPDETVTSKETNPPAIVISPIQENDCRCHGLNVVKSENSGFSCYSNATTISVTDGQIATSEDVNNIESTNDATNKFSTLSTIANSTAASSQMTEDIANGYRKCLSYFVPPTWAMDKNAMLQLSLRELAIFPLDDFFDHFEKCLKMLVSRLQLEANVKQKLQKLDLPQFRERWWSIADESDFQMAKSMDVNHSNSTSDIPNKIKILSTVINSTTVSSQMHENIAGGYRTLLRYFVPPQWVMDKNNVSQLSLQELASFPLDDFYAHYEKGLLKLVVRVQLLAYVKSQQAEAAKTKLPSVRCPAITERAMESKDQETTAKGSAGESKVLQESGINSKDQVSNGGKRKRDKDDCAGNLKK